MQDCAAEGGVLCIDGDESEYAELRFVLGVDCGGGQDCFPNPDGFVRGSSLSLSHV